MHNSQRGFNLLEMLTTIAVAVSTITMAVPAAQNTLERRALSAAAEEVFTFARLARTESIKRNRTVFMSLKTNANDSWCVGLAETAECDCNTAGACQLDGMERSVQSDDFGGVAMSQTFADGSTGFDARRGLAINAGQASLASDQYAVDVRLTTLGHVRMCAPAGKEAVAGVGQC